jgi:hypothetical protein
MLYRDDDLLSRDKLYPIDTADRVRADIPSDTSAVWTGEIRRPKAGEWYLRAGDQHLKGEVIFAYRAAANFTAAHAIATVGVALSRPAPNR